MEGFKVIGKTVLITFNTILRVNFSTCTGAFFANHRVGFVECIKEAELDAKSMSNFNWRLAKYGKNSVKMHKIG